MGCATTVYQKSDSRGLLQAILIDNYLKKLILTDQGELTCAIHKWD